MVGVDVDEGGIKAYRPLIEGNQRADPEGVHFRDRDGDRLAAIFVKGGASSAKKSLKVITASHALFHFELGGRPVFSDLDKGDKKVQYSIAQLLHVSVLIG